MEYWLRGYYEPPHRTGLEVFPHPALQEHSLYVWIGHRKDIIFGFGNGLKERNRAYLSIKWKAIIISEIEKAGLELNERQKKAFKHLLGEGKISTKDYCELNNIVPDTANRDLKDMVKKGLVKRVGKGRSTHYALFR